MGSTRRKCRWSRPTSTAACRRGLPLPNTSRGAYPRVAWQRNDSLTASERYPKIGARAISACFRITVPARRHRPRRFYRIEALVDGQLAVADTATAGREEDLTLRISRCDQLRGIREFVAEGKASSVSGFVQHAVNVALFDAAGWRTMLDDALRASRWVSDKGGARMGGYTSSSAGKARKKDRRQG